MSPPSPNPGVSKAYIVGAGIAGLATAVYLIRHAGFAGRNITLFDHAAVSGGALDGAGSPEHGYLIRGGRMHEAHFGCTWDLLAGIPSLDDPAVSVTDEVFAFNQRVVSESHARLVRAGAKVDVSSFGLSRGDIFDLLRLNLTPEALLEHKRIDEWFGEAFFDTVFWQLWATTFAFQRWSSVAEMRRYALRFMHLLPGFHQLKGILRTVYNQYDAVVCPLEAWLRQQGVVLRTQTPVVDIDFDLAAARPRATGFDYLDQGRTARIELGPADYLFVTLGSMVESSAVGSMDAPPAMLRGQEPQGAWALWQKIAPRHAAFGHPAAFCGDVARSTWMSFTVTCRSPVFFEYMENFTGNRAGTGGLVTLADSNWLMSVVLAHQPHFRNQPPGVFVFWGDGLLPDAPGNFVAKPMTQCSGREILAELFGHLRIDARMQAELAQFSCVPCLMPYIDSQFMPRGAGDRPAVVPAGAQNFD